MVAKAKNMFTCPEGYTLFPTNGDLMRSRSKIVEKARIDESYVVLVP